MKKQSGNALIIVLILVVLGFLLAAKLMKPLPSQETGAIHTVADLDAAAAQLDQTDIDGLGNELPQTDADAQSF